jgi:regulator of sirC expression with transglutaminase-like and TPR domain
MTPENKLHSGRIRQQFIETISAPEESLDLARAALLIAAEENPRLVLDHYLDQLNTFGAEVRERLQKANGNSVEVLNHFLFDEHCFVGNRRDYYDPRNSFLNEVLVRRKGIPITLSLVYMEVARRAGLKAEGIGFPGHFIVRTFSSDGSHALIDTFNCCRLDRDGCQGLLDNLYGGSVTLKDEHLRPSSKRQILTRMLTNLKAVYTRNNMHRKALAASDRILIVNPKDIEEHRDRGALLTHLERYKEAIEETETYLRLAPNAPDTEQVREYLSLIKREQAMKN